jgi:hypothetical protein
MSEDWPALVHVYLSFQFLIYFNTCGVEQYGQCHHDRRRRVEEKGVRIRHVSCFKLDAAMGLLGSDVLPGQNKQKDRQNIAITFSYNLSPTWINNKIFL